MDQLQVADLIKQFLADQGIVDVDICRKGCLEAATAFVVPPPIGNVDPDTLAQRVREQWGLDYSSILVAAAAEYQGSDLSPSEALIEIASNL